ncbi:MAG: hypothetical protein H0X42_08770 [Solirubrobacterales bacterium]|nr:hypothetical protein [Solirubrobacterales bacterium]
MKKNHLAKLLGAAVAALLAVAVVAPMAQATTPAPNYTQFAGCPSPSEIPFITSCLRSEVKSGYVKMGNKEVPITSPPGPITLSGGTGEELGPVYANSKGGLSPVKLKVPGGIIGLTGLTWLAEFLGSEALTLYAETQIAGQPVVNALNSITLPVKIHLINGALGNNCFVGSVSNPITWHLVTGTSGKLTGTPGKITFQETPAEILFSKGGKYVDNTWAAPGASGCVLTLFGFIPISINGLVNLASGLPAPAGVNEVVQFIDTEVAASEVVYP